MACPDRKNDAKILREIERRKTILFSSKPENNVEYITFHNNERLENIITFFDSDKIQSIEKTDDGWILALIIDIV